MVVLNIQQTTLADDIFRRVFADASMVNSADADADQMSPDVAFHMGLHS